MEGATSKPSAMTVNEFSKFVMDKNDLYELVLRNGYYLPKLSCGMCTEEYILNVLHAKYWCPKYEDIRVKPCSRPPPQGRLD